MMKQLAVIFALVVALMAGGWLAMAQDGGDRDPVTPVNVSDMVELAALEGHPYIVKSVAWHPNGDVLATAGANDEAVRLWAIPTGASQGVLEGHQAEVNGVAFSPDGQILASGSSDGSVRLWNVEQQAALAVLEGDGRAVSTVAFSPEGALLAAGGIDIVRLWDVATREVVRVLEGHVSGINAVAFAPDGTVLASVAGDGTLRLWDVATGTSLDVLNGTGGGINNVAYRPDGTFLAFAGVGRTVLVRNLATGETLSLEGHTAPVTGLSFSPDGGLLASSGADGTVRLWDMRAEAMGESLAAMDNPANLVWSLAWSPDGATLATGGDDGVVRLWGVPAPEPVVVASPTPIPDIFPTPTYADVQIAEQVFEHGRMFWIRHTRQIWVMQASPDNPALGDWRCYNDTFQEGEMEIDPDLVPPEGLYQPRRGFGKLWREHPEIKDGLGWALTPEFELTSHYTYVAGGFVEGDQYVPGPGEHRLTTLYNESISFFEGGGVPGDCPGGTWRLAVVE